MVSGEAHICPFACSRCDNTCPCGCRLVLLQEYEGDALAFREEVCIHDLVEGARPISRTGKIAHSWDCMDAHMLPCRCGADEHNARVTPPTEQDGGTE